MESGSETPKVLMDLDKGKKKRHDQSSKGYALFDLDQTLIPWDTQLLFCNWIITRYPQRRFFLLLFLPFLPLVKLLGAGGMKRVFISYLWKMETRQLCKEVRLFVQWLLKNQTYPELIDRFHAEKKQGRKTVITSASPELYVREIGRQLGADYAYGTRFDFDQALEKEETSLEESPELDHSAQISLFPDLETENHKGAAKVDRLRKEGLIGQEAHLRHSHAYSDSRADLPILQLCERATLVNPNQSLLQYGEQQGWEHCTPERPARKPIAFSLACVQQLFGLFPL